MNHRITIIMYIEFTGPKILNFLARALGCALRTSRAANQGPPPTLCGVRTELKPAIENWGRRVSNHRMGGMLSSKLAGDLEYLVTSSVCPESRPMPIPSNHIKTGS